MKDLRCQDLHSHDQMQQSGVVLGSSAAVILRLQSLLQGKCPSQYKCVIQRALSLLMRQLSFLVLTMHT